MIYALDTNIISYLLRPKRNPDVSARFDAAVKNGGYYVVPPLCYYEITWYLLRKGASEQLRHFQNLYQDSYMKAAMNEYDFFRAAQIKADLSSKGVTIDDSDIFISTFCLNRNLILVTNNIKHFEQIKDLQYENWKE